MRAYLVVLASFMVYLGSQIGLSIGAIPQIEGAFVPSAWQFPFFMGLVAGWLWKDTVLPIVKTRRWQVFAAGFLGTLIFFSLAQSSDIPYLRNANLDLSPHFDKYRLDPGVLVYFLCLVTFLGALITMMWRVKLVQPVLRLAALYGRHSLACFLILSLVQLATWIVAAPPDPHGGRDIAWLAVALGLFTAYCVLAERGKTPPSAVRATYAYSADHPSSR